MTDEILTAADVLHRRGRFLRMPTETHAVWFDDITTDSADRIPTIPQAGLPRTRTHNVTIEVYEPSPDDRTETDIEAELDARGIEWTKQDRYWVADAQRYQVVYEFTYIEK